MSAKQGGLVYQGIQSLVWPSWGKNPNLRVSGRTLYHRTTELGYLVTDQHMFAVGLVTSTHDPIARRNIQFDIITQISSFCLLIELLTNMKMLHHKKYLIPVKIQLFFHSLPGGACILYNGHVTTRLFGLLLVYCLILYFSPPPAAYLVFLTPLPLWTHRHSSLLPAWQEGGVNIAISSVVAATSQ